MDKNLIYEDRSKSILEIFSELDSPISDKKDLNQKLLCNLSILTKSLFKNESCNSEKIGEFVINQWNKVFIKSNVKSFNKNNSAKKQNMNNTLNFTENNPLDNYFDSDSASVSQHKSKVNKYENSLFSYTRKSSKVVNFVDLENIQQDISTIHNHKANHSTMSLISVIDPNKLDRISKIDNTLICDKSKSFDFGEIKNIIKSEMTEKQIAQICKEMRPEYIIDLFWLYNKFKTKLAKFKSSNSDCAHLINQLKQFLLETGISEKKIYEQCIRIILYNQNNFSFVDFYNCLEKVMSLKYEYNFVKYKFLLYLAHKREDNILENEDLERFMILAKSVFFDVR